MAENPYKVLSQLEEDMADALVFAGLPTPKREYRFDPKRRWRFDFAWPDLLIAIEVEGGIHSSGRHVRGSGFENDCEKYNTAASEGWLVLRVTRRMIEDGSAMKMILKVWGR